MSKYLRAILIGFAVAFVVSLLFSLALCDTGLGVFFGVFAGVFVAYILSNLAGNRKVAAASPAERQAALDFKAPDGRALVYVYREGFVAMAAGMNVAVDGQEVVQLKSPRFTRLVLSPGTHRFQAAFGGLAGAQSKASSYDFQAVAGQVAVLRIGANMGLIQGSISFTPAPDPAALAGKLGGMTMVAASPAEL